MPTALMAYLTDEISIRSKDYARSEVNTYFWNLLHPLEANDPAYQYALVQAKWAARRRSDYLNQSQLTEQERADLTKVLMNYPVDAWADIVAKAEAPEDKIPYVIDDPEFWQALAKSKRLRTALLPCRCTSWNPQDHPVKEFEPGDVDDITTFSVHHDGQRHVITANFPEFNVIKDCTIVYCPACGIEVRNQTSLGALCQWNRETQLVVRTTRSMEPTKPVDAPEEPTVSSCPPETIINETQAQAEERRQQLRRRQQLLRGRALQKRLAGIMDYLLNHWKVVRRHGQAITVLYREDDVVYRITEIHDDKTGTKILTARPMQGAELMVGDPAAALNHAFFKNVAKPDPAVQAEQIIKQIPLLRGGEAHWGPAVLHVLNPSVVTGFCCSDTLPDTGWTTPVDLSDAMRAEEIPGEPALSPPAVDEVEPTDQPTK